METNTHMLEVLYENIKTINKCEKLHVKDTFLGNTKKANVRKSRKSE